MSKTDTSSQKVPSDKKGTAKKGKLDSSAEDFIVYASELLEAFPSALVSIAYLVYENQENSVKFTVSHPGQSKYIIYESHDAKEVSRILAFIGPGGITADIVNSEKKKTSGEENESSEKKQERVTGILSVMSNHDAHSS